MTASSTGWKTATGFANGSRPERHRTLTIDDTVPMDVGTDVPTGSPAPGIHQETERQNQQTHFILAPRIHGAFN